MTKYLKIFLRAFIEGGDLVAKEEKYHPKCYTNLTKCPSTASGAKEKDASPLCERMAFASLYASLKKSRLLKTLRLYSKLLISKLRIEQPRTFSWSGSKDLPNTLTVRLRERILYHQLMLNFWKSGNNFQKVLKLFNLFLYHNSVFLMRHFKLWISS